jgi:hypothetical protein
MNRKIIMGVKKGLISVLIGLLPVIGLCQKTDSLINKPDNLQTQTTGQHDLVEPAFYNERTKVNAKVFAILLLGDFKQQALSPLALNKKDGSLVQLLQELQ